MLAGLLVRTFGVLGSTGAFLGLLVTTVALTTVITNNAAAILMFPIAFPHTAPQVGLDVRSTAITMLYGPCGYQFGDYSRPGVPLTFAAVLTVVLPTPHWGS